MRTIVQGDALAWLASNEAAPHTSVVTSLPDVSELSAFDLPAWKQWFVATAALVMRWTPEVAIFYQSDIRFRGALVDKGYLVLRAAEEVGADVLFHRVVCRRPAGTVSHGRPSWSHLIAVSRGGWSPARSPGPDVLEGGEMLWSKGMGVGACRESCRWLRENTGTTMVVDPFCGLGTVVAVAESMGFEALGVELGAKRCKQARALQV